MPKDWNGVCPNCSGSGIEPISIYGKHNMSCLCCDGTGDRTIFLYKLMAGEIRREGSGWGPQYDTWAEATILKP